MKKLSLLRHAKSDWHDPAQRDFDRPLNEKGQNVSHAMGRWVASQKIAFDYILASPAIRVKETLEYFAHGYERHIKTQWDRKIYLASSVTILDVIKECDDAHSHILVVGHNPGLEDIIFDLIPDDGSSPLRDIIEAKYPTGAYAQLHSDSDRWANIADSTTRLEMLKLPREINPDFGPDML